MHQSMGTLLSTILLATSLGGLVAPPVAAQAVRRPTPIAQSATVGREIRLKSAPNVRDLGGYVNQRGQRIKPHRLIRSASLSNLSPADGRKLAKVYHLKTDVDLRTLSEQTTAPDAKIAGVRHVSDPVFLKWGKASGNLSDRVKGNGVKNMETFYRNAVLSRQGRHAYRTLFLILLKTPRKDAVLWHCSAGKDRAGMGTMLILSALDVSRRTINRDYLLSNRYLAAKNAVTLSQDRRNGDTATQLANAKAQAGVRMAFLNAAYRAIDHHYGSVQRYLHRGLGLTSAQLTRLQKAYLTPAKH
ncbi:hypothetical protein VC81_05720 [Levilactobacillus spicheri]|uniref:Protein tyrosine phosphatase n=2 Tax=Levilactobacillus spicheri TaxID=216463 RepID=A0A0F3RSL5_9LACO|nr:hypothetical protein VC81_05720 [Levilactobacillus spicheri]